LQSLLPVFHGFTNVVVDVAQRTSMREGKAISCRDGCAACCRQLVPVSEPEARALTQLVATLPADRQEIVRTRFADAVRKLDEAGLLDQLRQKNADVGTPIVPLGLEYFALGIACPFLEGGSCSIYPQRPMSCREYLVTSPAEECAHPSRETVRRVPLPAQVALAVRTVDTHASRGWVPMILALEWTAAHPDAGNPRPGPAWVQDVFTRLAGSLPPS
jgi:Fe-S-cluster containining protein